TSFYMMVGLLPADGGRIFLEGQEITALPMYQRCRMGVGYLPQESSVFRKLTVEENLLAILETLDLTRDERRERAHDLLAELDLTPLAQYPAYTLSGGERRRLEITRALVTSPQYLLLDEPFTGIDPIAITDIQGIVGRLRERGIGILITDHNVRETLAITDRAYILYDGKILVSGTATEIASHPVAREIHPGEPIATEPPVAERQTDDLPYDPFEVMFDAREERSLVAQEDREDLPFENMVRTTSSLADHLEDQLRLALEDPRARRVGEEIIGNIDEDGYLRAELGEVAAR